jgi:hypothetical protein
MDEAVVGISAADCAGSFYVAVKEYSHQYSYTLKNGTMDMRVGNRLHFSKVEARGVKDWKVLPYSSYFLQSERHSVASS